MFGPMEIALIFLVILLVFGAKRIPEIARGLGKGIREFKDATNDIKQELTVDPSPPRRIPPAQPTPQTQASQPAAFVAPEPMTPPPAEGQAPESQA